MDKLRALNVPPETAEIVMRDSDIVHFLRDPKDRPLPVEWLRRLPYHVREPKAVLLDQTQETPALLLLFDAPAGYSGAAKLVVSIDYVVKKAGGKKMNILASGKLIDASGVRGMIGTSYTLIAGEL